MKQIFTLLVLFFISANALWAQNATLQGRVTGTDDEPLIGATVVIGAFGAATDLDGRYEFKAEAGSYSMKVTYTGYESTEQPVEVTPGQVLEMDIVMKEVSTILDEATITGGKFEKPLGEQIVSLDVMKPRLIENSAVASIDKVLDKIPGVDIIDGQANIRGGSGFSSGAGSRVMLLVDDLPFLQGDLGIPQWDDVPIEMIDQIEVLKGAASALYGSAALNGVINVRTIYPTSKPVTKAAAFTTIYGTPRNKANKWWDDGSAGYPFAGGFQFSHIQRVKKWSYAIGANLLGENGYVQNTYNNRGRVSGKLSYNITDKIILGVNGFFNAGSDGDYFYWKNSNDGGQLQGYADPSAFISGTHTRYAVDPYVTFFDGVGNRHKLQGRIYHTDNNNTNNQANSHTLSYGEYQYQAKFDQLGLNVVAGAVAQHVYANSPVFNFTTVRSLNAAPYLQAEWRPINNLTISTGVRYEYNHLSGPDSVITADGSMQVVPDPKITEGRPVFRFGANYKAGEGTYFRASIGQGYRFPTMGEKFIYTRAALAVLPNPNLKSETGWSSEIGVKQGFKMSEWSGFVDASAFVMEYDRMMEFVVGGVDPINNPIFGIQAANIGDTRILGGEVSVAGQGKLFGVPINIITGYTYIDPKYKNYGAIEKATSSDTTRNVLKYRFRHTFKFDAEATVLKSLTVGLSSQYRSKQQNVDPLFNIVVDGYAPYAATLTGKWVMDARVQYAFSDHAKVTLVCRNFLNEEYQLRPAKSEAPRNVTMRLDMVF